MDKNFRNEILSILKNPTGDEIKKLSSYHESDVADAFCELNEDERKKLYQTLKADYISNLFTYLDDPSEYISELDSEQLGNVLNEMDADDVVDVLEDVDEDSRNDYLGLLDNEALEDVRLIKSYDDDEIGSMMTTNYVSLNKDISVKMAMKKIIEIAPENDNINIIYFTNDDNTYFGALPLKDLIIARENTVLTDIIKTNYPILNEHEILSNVLEDLKDYSLDSIAVLNENREIIGIITSDDIINAVDEELTEDYVKLAAMSGEFNEDETVTQAVKKRIPWLFALLVLGFLVSSVMSLFETVIKELAIVVYFQTIVLDMAGNAGTQSLAVTIRIISEDVSNKVIRKIIGKELRIGALNGIIVGSSSLILVAGFLLITRFSTYNFPSAVMIGLTVAIALIISMAASNLCGTLMPILFKKMKIDPAVASGPFITTLNDLIAVAVYYGVAWLILLT